MALIDVVRHEMKDGEFCAKYPSDDLRIGSQLVVYPAQTAFFVKGGMICDEFLSGTYTIKTNNIPILNKLINLPFGGDTPFRAEVWFVNNISKLDLSWGTPTPIQVEDPKYNIIVPVRAHGQYGIQVINSRAFLETLIGNMQSFSADKICQYFKGKITSALNTLIANQIINEKTSILDINTLLLDMSEKIEDCLNNILGKYGIKVVEFSIASITVPENDSSVVRLKKAKDLVAELSITGRDVYQMRRSFDVLESAASNEGAGGQMAGAGMGLGIGMSLGNSMLGISSSTLDTKSTPPPLPQEKLYYLYINGTQIGNLNIQQIRNYIQQGLANATTLAWHQGLPQWVNLSSLEELNSLLLENSTLTPPPINS